ncbi:alpha/beta hydrolase [Streptomyces sp. NPDC004286]|uniref:alpha/beta hydrolase n=1 Tax=Streptomyces sp. NPDC004286 TaxID=3364696 RepID=UPI00368E64F6
METVTFKNKHVDVAADIHFPPGFDPAQKYPAIVSAHPVGSCKEQTSGSVYGKALAEAGFVVLAFDASFQAGSGGEPRQLEDATWRVEDFRCAADYLVTLDYVDEDRIGVFGMCAGGGYTWSAAMTERRFKAVATVTGVNLGRLLRQGDMSADAAITTLEAIAKQRTAEARGGERRLDSSLPPSVEKAAELGLVPPMHIDVAEATEYYKTPRGAHPHGTNLWLFSSLAPTVGFDAYHLADKLLTQPLLLIVGNKPGEFGAYRDAYTVFDLAASKDKELVVIPDVSHYDLYDKPEAVQPALDALIPFFKKHL